MNNIDICIAMGNNSERYLEFLLLTIKKTVEDTSSFRIILGLNGADEDLVKKIAQESGFDFLIVSASNDAGYGSLSHGLCLNSIFSHVSAKYTLCVDCDVAFIKRDWDKLLLSKLDETTAIIGAEYDGFKYKKFPNVICALFDTAVAKKLEISFVPEGVISITNVNREIYGYDLDSVGLEIILDTGSELPRKFKNVGYSGVSLPLIRASNVDAKFMTENLRGEEYILDDEPIFTHLGRSFSRQFGVNEHAIAWENRVREWLKC